MSTKEQEKIIKKLRDATVQITFTEELAQVGDLKFDKKAMWEKAKKAGKTISDDSLSPPHTSGS